MRKFYILLMVMVCGLSLNAQYYLISSTNAGVNPAGNLNTDIEEPSGLLTPLGWSQILGSTSTDVWSSNQNIPFPFDFDGSPVSSYKVSNTGVLTFTTSATAVPPETNVAIPTAIIPDKSVCAWGINISGTNDAIVSKTFGTAPNRQHWVTYSSASEATLGTAQWTYWSIVLEEGSNSIYVVDQRTYGDTTNPNVTLTVGVQVDASTAIQVGSSPNLGSNTTATAGNDNNADDNTYYEFAYGTQPTYDMDLQIFELEQFLGIGSPANANILVRNRSTGAVNSYDLNYTLNGGATVTSSITGVSLASGGIATPSLSNPINPSSGGMYTAKLWVSNINGNADMNNGNDTLEVSFEAANTFPRNLLSEKFTSATCPPCKSWNDNVYNAALANYNELGNRLVINYQVPIPVAGDPSRNGDSDDRRSYYGISSAPTMLVNGVEPEGYANITTWGDAVNAYNQAETDGLAQPAFVKIDAGATYDGRGNMGEVDVNATVTSNIDMTSGAYRAHIVVLQREYIFNGASNGDFQYHHVMRKMLPNANGTTLNIAANGTQTINESYNFNIGGVADGNFNLWNHDIEIIVFVENTTNQTIMNARQINIQPIGLDEDWAKMSLSTYPNPASDFLIIEGDKTFIGSEIQLINNTGQLVRSFTSDKEKMTLQINDLTSGIYTVRVINGNKSVSKNVVINN